MGKASGPSAPARRQTAVAAALLTFVVASAASAQQSMRVRGTIERVDGPTLVIKAAEAGEVKVTLADNAAVFAVVKASLSDVKPGSFIGVGATPQPDGSQRAIQVTIFAESQRGTGEGHRPWDRPNTTMTNATVIDTTVASVDGRVVMVKYQGGEQKIVVPAEAALRAYVASDRSELKPGASVAILSAVKKPDGTLEAARVNVGRGGVVP